MLLVCVATASAQSPSAVIRIDTSLNYPLGPTVEIPIILEYLEPGLQINGFELEIGIEYPNAPSQFAGFLWDEEILESGWSRLVWFEDVDDCEGEYCPTWILRIRSQVIPGQSLPLIDSPRELCRILFKTAGDLDTFYPIRFFWFDCSNNFVTFEGGEDTMLVSSHVYEYDGTELTGDMAFPSYLGAPDSCLQPELDDTTRVRAVDFYHGGLKMTVVDTPLVTRNAVRIEKTHNTEFGQIEEVSVTLEQIPEGNELLSFGSFDFLIEYDAQAATLLSARAGQLLDDCGWEYFTWRNGSDGACGDGDWPDGVVRIVAVADIENGVPQPLCLADSVGELAVLTFETTEDADTYECLYSQVRFLWCDCADNTVAVEPTADSLYVSNNVFIYDALPPATQERDFPTTYGAPYECLGEVIPGKFSTRAIDFYHGGFDFRCLEDLDQRGDINLNEVAYEIADFVLFSNYFLYGLSVFSVNVEAQIAATDCNADGMTLTLNDLIFLYRVIIDDVTPFPAPPSPRSLESDTCVVVHNIDLATVSIEYPDSLAAVFLTFGDSIFPVSDLPDFGAASLYTAPYTRVLMGPNSPHPPDCETCEMYHFGAGELFTYTGAAQLLSVEVSYDGTTYIPTAIRVDGSSTCCGDRGNVDGVNGPGLPINISDLVYLVAYLFEGGPQPPCIEEGNVDGSSDSGAPIDIVDITYFVEYMFAGGPPPPPCPTAPTR
jgi:hypothetical protein